MQISKAIASVTDYKKGENVKAIECPYCLEVNTIEQWNNQTKELYQKYGLSNITPLQEAVYNDKNTYYYQCSKCEHEVKFRKLVNRFITN